MANQSQAESLIAPDKDKLSEEEQAQHVGLKDLQALPGGVIIILLVTLLVAQIVLNQWKSRHFRSYQRTTLLCMWLIPIVLCLNLAWWRFCIIWLVFSIITAFVTFKASRKSLSGSTPRWVYKWFLLLHKLSYASGILGYLAVIAALFGLNNLILVETKTAVNLGLHLLFYGIYFGVVSRDFAEVCADTMAAHIGYYSVTGLPAKRLDSNKCAVCGNDIFMVKTDAVTVEKTIKLTCGHTFHEFCIRGWCIVGKKQICPYCKEKVDLKRMFPGPWERPHMLFGSLLDWIRYFVAWQPVIIVIVHIISHSFGLE